ncbi:hypothetical protein ABK040_010426 [Willaertia magna]
MAQVNYNFFCKQKHTDEYERYRFEYPNEIFSFIKEQLNEKTDVIALDVACGNGLATFELSKFCKFVLAIDPSENQLSNAKEKMNKKNVTNIKFERGSAETLEDLVKAHLENLESNEAHECFDLIVVAQALHWFNFDTFFRNVEKLLKPGGVFVAWGFTINEFKNQKAQEIQLDFYENTLKEYWTERRLIIDQKYKTIPFVPFPQLTSNHTLYDNRRISLQNYVKYIGTLSALNRYHERFGDEKKNQLLGDFQEKLLKALDLFSKEDEIDLNLPIHLLVTKKPTNHELYNNHVE